MQNKDKKSPWVIAIFAFFIVLFSVNGYLVFMAYKTNNGLIESSPYEKGVEYQKVINQLKLTKKDGIKSKLEISDKNISLTLLKKNSPLSGAKVIAKFKSSKPEIKDFQIELTEDPKEKGHYSQQAIKIKEVLYFYEIYILKKNKTYLIKDKTLIS